MAFQCLCQLFLACRQVFRSTFWLCCAFFYYPLLYPAFFHGGDDKAILSFLLSAIPESPVFYSLCIFGPPSVETFVLTSRFQIFSFIHQKGSSHRRSPQQAITFSGLQLIHVFPNGIASFFLQKTEFPIVREA